MENNVSDEVMDKTIELWLEEFAVNSELFCPVEYTKETLASPLYSTDANGKRYLIVLTDPNDDVYPYYVKVPYEKIFNTVMNNDNCDGIIVDPTEDGTPVSKQLMIKVNGKRSGNN